MAQRSCSRSDKTLAVVYALEITAAPQIDYSVNMDVWEGIEEIDTPEYRSVLWYAIDTCLIIYMQVQIRWRRHQSGATAEEFQLFSVAKASVMHVQICGL